MKANTVIVFLIVAAVIGGAAFFFLRKSKGRSAGTSIRTRTPRPVAPWVASPRLQVNRPPLARPPAPPAPRPPSLKQQGLDLYQAGCGAVAGAKGVPPAISSFACDPRANFVLQANIKAGEFALSGAKAGVKAVGSLFGF